MLYLSDILIEHKELENFEQLVDVLEQAKKGHTHFRMDVKPPFPDTPDNWEDRLEAVFS